MATLAKVGAQIRQWIVDTPFPAKLEHEWLTPMPRWWPIPAPKSRLQCVPRRLLKTCRMPSFAGQQETFLNIHGLDNVKIAIKHVFASLYNDRAIAYRVHKGFTQ